MSKNLHAKYVISQGAVIENNNGAVLILKLQDGGWVIPGGHLHDGEDWIDGLRREIFEETGIKKFEVGDILGVSVFGKCYGIGFHCKVVDNNKVVLSEEHEDFVWVNSKEDLEGYVFHAPILKDLVLKVLDKSILKS